MDGWHSYQDTEGKIVGASGGRTYQSSCTYSQHLPLSSSPPLDASYGEDYKETGDMIFARKLGLSLQAAMSTVDRLEFISGLGFFYIAELHSRCYYCFEGMAIDPFNRQLFADCGLMLGALLGWIYLCIPSMEILFMRQDSATGTEAFQTNIILVVGVHYTPSLQRRGQSKRVVCKERASTFNTSRYGDFRVCGCRVARERLVPDQNTPVLELLPTYIKGLGRCEPQVGLDSSGRGRYLARVY
ncbi:hypothetical protein EDD18DRAFT_1102767 [Armillaria luteobubalina]|uniref:Uncharacterized protein n=1 Tax=Armillaria luteobubalina TaxID=153913 RepID=A0AA39QDA4_9AGAR|nr:hypothetical protein EDD18DRAFT_1102767 [Armillaria luteobubalina]